MNVFDNPDIKLEVVGTTKQGLPIIRISGPAVEARNEALKSKLMPTEFRAGNENMLFELVHIHSPVEFRGLVWGEDE